MLGKTLLSCCSLHLEAREHGAPASRCRAGRILGPAVPQRQGQARRAPPPSAGSTLLLLLLLHPRISSRPLASTRRHVGVASSVAVGQTLNTQKKAKQTVKRRQPSLSAMAMSAQRRPACEGPHGWEPSSQRSSRHYGCVCWYHCIARRAVGCGSTFVGRGAHKGIGTTGTCATDRPACSMQQAQHQHHPPASWQRSASHKQVANLAPRLTFNQSFTFSL